jgi:hypothetical protein
MNSDVDPQGLLRNCDNGRATDEDVYKRVSIVTTGKAHSSRVKRIPYRGCKLLVPYKASVQASAPVR